MGAGVDNGEGSDHGGGNGNEGEGTISCIIRTMKKYSSRDSPHCNYPLGQQHNSSRINTTTKIEYQQYTFDPTV